MMNTIFRALKGFFILAVGAGSLFVAVLSAEAQQLFGPVRYDVKERYGEENRYTETVRAPEGPALVRLQNGSQPSERPDIIELSMNGKQLLGEGRYDYPVILCFVILKKENTIELNLRDQIPQGMRRPPVLPKLVVLSLLSVPARLPEGVYGIDDWAGLKEYVALFQKIRRPESVSLAVEAADLRQEVPARIEALRKLAERQDRDARDYLIYMFRDYHAAPGVRAEAALALGKFGERQMVPALLDGILDSHAVIRLNAARALSMYPEEDSREHLERILESLDPIRKTAVIQAIVGAGWKPVATIGAMARSSDTRVSSVAIELLGSMKEPRATDLLLDMLGEQGNRNSAVIIRALGNTGDSRAVDALLVLARDRLQRKGRESLLGAALANLGDRKAAGAILEMGKSVDSDQDLNALQDAYAKLTGSSPQPEGK